MNYKTIIVKIEENYIAEITLNRPDKYNTFDETLAKELNEALWSLDSNNKIRVIILKGAGKVFCAGIDLNDFKGKTEIEYKAWFARMEKPLVTISKISKPVIAQVHGFATANGVGLVASADLAIAGLKTRFGLTAINVGLNCIGPVIPVAKSIGRKKALEMLFMGKLLKAEKAVEIGLINKAVPEEELGNEVGEWAILLAEKSPIALQHAKKSFYEAVDKGYYQSIDYMTEEFAKLCVTEDAKEGVDAFLSKRKPEWKER